MGSRLTLPCAANRQIKYKTTSIESRYKYPILTEPDLGVTVNLIDPNAYHFYLEDEEKPPLDAKDAFLAELKVDPPGTKKVASRPKPRVAWLRKTEYMANDLYEPATKFKSQIDTMATFRDIASRKNSEAEQTVEERLAEIENSFDLAKEPAVHPDNKELTVVKETELLPNLDFWASQCTTIGFDSNAWRESGHSREDSQRAVVKAFQQVLEDDGRPEQFIGYMLPKKRKAEDDLEAELALAVQDEDEEKPKEEKEEFDWIRNYSFQHEGEEGEQTLILIETDMGECTFVLVKSRLALHRVAQIKENLAKQYHPSRVDLTRRPFRTHERNARGRRKREGLGIPYESEPDSEPEPEPEAPMIEDEDEDVLAMEGDGEGGGGEEEDAISGDEAAPPVEGEEAKVEPSAASRAFNEEESDGDDDDL